MKKLRKSLVFICMALSLLSLQSCLDDDDDNNYNLLYPNALVTVKHNSANGGIYFQLDDSTTLVPTNIKSDVFGSKEVRALMNFKYVEKDAGHYGRAVYVNWIDSVRTKDCAPDCGENNDKVYGNDPVEMVNDWVTVVEDNYITLRFRTVWGSNKPHVVNLVKGTNKDNPYELVFRQNANGDVNGRVADGIVAFSLKDLPDTNGKTVDLTLKWHSFNGDKSVKFKYCTQKSVASKTVATSCERFVNTVK